MKRRLLARKRSLAAAALVVLVGGGLALAYYIDMHLPFWHFRTVEEGAFYRTSQLDGEQFRRAVREYGIRTIVNLRAERERAEGDWYEQEQTVAREEGVRLLDVPLEAGTPPSPAQVALLLSVMDRPESRPVLVHCYHGSIRSAALEGLYRREYMGEDGPRALRRVESWGRDLAADYPRIAEFIRDYVPRRLRLAGEP